MRPLRPEESQWIFKSSALNNTRSRDDGISLEDELRRRKEVVGYMRSLAIRAIQIANPDRNPADTIESSHLRGSLNIASTLLHRFYMRRSFNDFSAEIIAPTLLFLATKIEEEPLKLRHIVNACLVKFGEGVTQQWFPTQDGNEQPSHGYKRWERDVLVTEEIVLEALCFDMGVEQPWVILRRSVQGLDVLKENNGETSKSTSTLALNGNGNGRRKDYPMSESIVTELGWSLLSESLQCPLCILHPAPILAFATFTLVISLIERLAIHQALTHAAELGEQFHLDIEYDVNGAKGGDVIEVRECLEQFLAFCKTGLIDDGLIKYFIEEEADEPPPDPYPRLFRKDTTDQAESQIPLNGTQEIIEQSTKTNGDI